MDSYLFKKYLQFNDFYIVENIIIILNFVCVFHLKT